MNDKIFFHYKLQAMRGERLAELVTELKIKDKDISDICRVLINNTKEEEEI